jgi:hypothetical protein
VAKLIGRRKLGRRSVFVAIGIVAGLTFAGCGLRMLWLSNRIRQILVQRHPDVWRATKWSEGREALIFAYKRRDRHLDDVELTSFAKQVRLVIWLAVVAWLFAIVGLLARPNF